MRGSRCAGSRRWSTDEPTNTSIGYGMSLVVVGRGVANEHETPRQQFTTAAATAVAATAAAATGVVELYP